MRGPLNMPASIASRTATITRPVQPGSTSAVCPEHSVRCALTTARSARNSTGAYMSISSSTCWAPNEQWVWASLMPGMTK